MFFDAAPLGHSRPRELGLACSPSTWITLPSFTYASWAQPTAQKGQIDCATWSASAMRGRSAFDLGDCAARPSPSGSPSRSWRTTGHEPSSLLNATDPVVPGAAADKPV